MNSSVETTTDEDTNTEEEMSKMNHAVVTLIRTGVPFTGEISPLPTDPPVQESHPPHDEVQHHHRRRHNGVSSRSADVMDVVDLTTIVFGSS